jgi:hypothetical protein
LFDKVILVVKIIDTRQNFEFAHSCLIVVFTVKNSLLITSDPSVFVPFQELAMKDQKKEKGEHQHQQEYIEAYIIYPNRL